MILHSLPYGQGKLHLSDAVANHHNANHFSGRVFLCYLTMIFFIRCPDSCRDRLASRRMIPLIHKGSSEH